MQFVRGRPLFYSPLCKASFVSSMTQGAGRCKMSSLATTVRLNRTVNVWFVVADWCHADAMVEPGWNLCYLQK